MITAKYFEIYELVPKKVYEDRGEKAWQLLDERAIVTLDQLRQDHGPITVNDWQWGGSRQWSGLRTSECDVGRQYSQHRLGRAFDCLFRFKSAEQVRQFILCNPEKYRYLTSMELNTSWLHFDVRNCDPIKTY